MCAGSVNTKLRSAVKEWYFQGERSMSSTFLLYRTSGPHLSCCIKTEGCHFVFRKDETPNL